MRSEAYLTEIRRAEGLKRAVLRKIAVQGKTVTFYLVTDLTYTAEDIAHARRTSQTFLPEGCLAQVNVMKSVPSAENVRAAISAFLKNKFPAAAAFISPEDVEVITDGAGGRFVLAADEAERRRFESGEVLDALSAELMLRFCGTWIGGYRAVEREKEELECEAPPPAERIVAPRTFPIAHYQPLDGAKPELAVCIADLAGEQQNITVCGKLVRIEERLTKKEKPFFRIVLQDDTSQLTASYFSKKATLERVRKLQPGASLCLTGNYEVYNDTLSFTAKAVDFGEPPEGYVPQQRASRPAPALYTAVQPEPVSDPEQETLFGEIPLPREARGKTYVVFDLETTGLSCTSDRIIEIGAVKIAGGEIREKFSSFVACPVRLSPKIVSLTGITDAMLVGAPTVETVVADFYKFTEGCELVAHNAPFDCGFVRHVGEKEGYLFDQKVHDTLVLAQHKLPLPNYRLDTIAERFNFKFNHHRAFDDAFVTAKIFLRLLRI